MYVRMFIACLFSFAMNSLESVLMLMLVVIFLAWASCLYVHLSIK